MLNAFTRRLGNQVGWVWMGCICFSFMFFFVCGSIEGIVRSKTVENLLRISVAEGE